MKQTASWLAVVRRKMPMILYHLLFGESTAYFFPLNDHNHQVDYFLSLMVRAGYNCVAKIDRLLTWTTGSLSCAQMFINACDCTRGVHGHRKNVCIDS